MAIGQAKNTRPTEVTEIGIRAQVWSQANSLANFKTVPSPSKSWKVRRRQRHGQRRTDGKYMRRTAFFELAVRTTTFKGSTLTAVSSDRTISTCLGQDIIDNDDVCGETAPSQLISFGEWIGVRQARKRGGGNSDESAKPAATMIRFKEAADQHLRAARGCGPCRHRGQYILETFTSSILPCRSIQLDQLYDLPEMSAGLQKVPAEVDCSNVFFTEDTGTLRPTIRRVQRTRLGCEPLDGVILEPEAH